MPHKSDAVVNMAMQIKKNRFRPITLVIHPVMGSTIAFATNYVVNTHGPWFRLAPRFPEMCGRATFAMLVSRTSMKAAMATTTAINHGLNFGFHSETASVGNRHSPLYRELISNRRECNIPCKRSYVII